MPAFLFILLLTPCLLLLAVMPVLSILSRRIYQGFIISRKVPWISEGWWNKWYSWIAIGGPPGRWVVGALLGVRELQRIEQEMGGHDAPGDQIAEPGIALFLTVGFAILLSLFATVSNQ